MQTSLPDLAFPFTGIYVNPNMPKSASKASLRAFLRTDLQALHPWTSFMNDIGSAIDNAMTLKNLPRGMPLTVGIHFRKPTHVANEEALRSHVDWELNKAVVDVLEVLGIRGQFDFSGAGNVALVGNPDFAWIQESDMMLQKLVVEYKTDWVADLMDLQTFFLKSNRSRNEKQSIEALEQLYGYMTFNNNKYGILSNWTRAWFLRRIETGNRETLECASVELGGSAQSPSMLKAVVGMIILADRCWFYASPNPNIAPPSRFFGPSTVAREEQRKALSLCRNYKVTPVNGTYPLLNLDFRLCDFQLSSTRSSGLGCVVRTELRRDVQRQPPINAMCKVIDIAHNPNNTSVLEAEARAYAALYHLQGKVVPRLYGYYNVWGILHLLALEPVGNAVSENQAISRTLRQKMKRALQRIHEAGYVHGDIARRNFCVRDGEVFLVDLETCQATSSPSMKAAELVLVDSL